VSETLEQVVGRLEELTDAMPVEWERPLPNRVYLTVPREHSRELGRLIFEELGARFATATGLDTGRELEVVYHFPYDAVGLVVNMRVRAPKADPTMPSLTPVAPAAEWIEREINDLVGVRFEGHPRPERLILSDDWPEGVYPLREEFREEFRDE
jgi:NADH-quinone oxidoreductase subunit C